MADKKQRFAILSRFKKRLGERGIHADINIYSQQWAAEAMIESYGYEETLDAIDYYFTVSASPDWSWFAYNSEKVIQSKKSEEEDRVIRAKLRAGAKKWLES
jgi:hypothetical protein